MKRELQKGQTIIEAIAALFTILIILTAIAIVVVNGLYNSQFIKNQNTANKYAQQAMELVRNMQKNDLKNFSNVVMDEDGSITTSTFCLNSNEDDLTSTNCSTTGVNAGVNFNRTVQFFPPGSECNTNEVRATVVVAWASSKCSGSTYCHRSELVSCLPFNTPASLP